MEEAKYMCQNHMSWDLEPAAQCVTSLAETHSLGPQPARHRATLLRANHRGETRGGRDCPCALNPL